MEWAISVNKATEEDKALLRQHLARLQELVAAPMPALDNAEAARYRRMRANLGMEIKKLEAWFAA